MNNLAIVIHLRYKRPAIYTKITYHLVFKIKIEFTKRHNLWQVVIPLTQPKMLYCTNKWYQRSQYEPFSLMTPLMMLI